MSEHLGRAYRSFELDHGDWYNQIIISGKRRSNEFFSPQGIGSALSVSSSVPYHLLSWSSNVFASTHQGSLFHQKFQYAKVGLSQILRNRAEGHLGGLSMIDAEDPWKMTDASRDGVEVLRRTPISLS